MEFRGPFKSTYFQKTYIWSHETSTYSKVKAMQTVMLFYHVSFQRLIFQSNHIIFSWITAKKMWYQTMDALKSSHWHCKAKKLVKMAKNSHRWLKDWSIYVSVVQIQNHLRITNIWEYVSQVGSGLVAVKVKSRLYTFFQMRIEIVLGCSCGRTKTRSKPKR